jgi:hypothetical protein
MNEFFTWLWKILDLPALMLVAVMVLMFYVLYRIQQNPNNNFDFADMFRDETGKPSAARVMVLICGGVSSWLLMYMVIHDDNSRLDPLFYGLYLGAWSGTALASKWMDLSRLNANAQINLRADYKADMSDRRRRDSEDDEDERVKDRPTHIERDTGAESRRELEREQALSKERKE